MTLCGLAACLGSFQMTEQILSVSRQWVLNSNTQDFQLSAFNKVER